MTHLFTEGTQLIPQKQLMLSWKVDEWSAPTQRLFLDQRLVQRLDVPRLPLGARRVAAQIEVESKFESSSPCSTFKR
jgi:hypothetical protein